jgi:ribonuclease BN (tRNA processing enzyme)
VLRPGRSESVVGKRFADNYHTSIDQLTELARQAKPGLLIIYHQGATALEGLFDEFRAKYSGHFVISRDLDVF